MAQEDSVFGKKENSGQSLIGIIYDLKQNQKRSPTGVNPGHYVGIVDEFLMRNWEEAILNRYFRAARPMYTSQIYIPLMSADEAPKAFGVQSIIRPSAWVVHYKGQVSPPEDGRYRFLSYSDDVIAVGVNGKTVCAGPHTSMTLKAWKRPEVNNGPDGGMGQLVYGNWMDLKKDEPVDLDVIVGERPGGQFCAFLLYQKQGVAYPKEGNVPLYPLFQLAKHETMRVPTPKGPPFSLAKEVWKAYE